MNYFCHEFDRISDEDKKEALEITALDPEFESVIGETLSRWTGTEIDSQKLKDCLLRAHIVRSSDLELLTAASDKWTKLRTEIGLEEMEGIYILNRLKVMAFGGNRGNAIRSVSDCNHMELLYVVMEYVLPKAKGVKDQDKLLECLMEKDNLDGNEFLDLGRQEFVKLVQNKGGLGKWTAGKLYTQIKEFKF